MQIVIFKNQNSIFSLLVPTQEALQIATIEQIAKKMFQLDVLTG